MATRFNVCERRLPPQERMLVQNSIAELRANNPKIMNLSFWGKVQGDTNDYLILVALNIGETINRIYFVSSDGGNSFAQVPDVNGEDWVGERCATLYRAFEGTLGFVYPTPKAGGAGEGAGDEDGEDGENDDDAAAVGDILNDAPRPATLTEMHRLAWTLREIDRSCAVAPFGAYSMSPTKVMALDQTFKGLSAKSAARLESYTHLRAPETARVRQKLERAATSFHGAQCLDPIQDDVPKGVWVPRLDEDESSVTLRSLQWPGHEFVSQLNTPEFYNVYFGSGLQNHDLVFMI